MGAADRTDLEPKVREKPGVRASPVPLSVDPVHSSGISAFGGGASTGDGDGDSGDGGDNG